MPIRFRCVYCNQLLGISRRKAGTIVRCTSCEGQLIVPELNDAATEAGNQGPAIVSSAEQPAKTDDPGPGPGVFDAAEFDAFLQPLGGSGPVVTSPPAPSARRSPAPTMLERRPVPALVVTRRGLTIAVALATLGMGL